jgi:NAD(P)-dependent dehydrogenase (short-subunit alcohol dehydrogenase family)
MDLKLKGMNAIVTGGSKGIGRAIVEGLAAEGVNVAFCARGADGVKAAEEAIKANGGNVVGTAIDVGNKSQLEKWVDDSANAFGGLDIVVCNVSALAITPDNEENWEASMNVDVLHTVRTCRKSLPYLEKSKNPSIINISSVSGREADFAGGPYGTAKSAIIAYTAHLAFSLAEKGIRANTVSPGNTYFDGGVWQNIEQGNPDLFKFAMGLNPTGRMGTPEEQAFAVVMLASPLASRISGTNLVVDGALTRGIQF